MLLVGGGKGDRTPDLMTASHALSHLSYTPTGVVPASGTANIIAKKPGRARGFFKESAAVCVHDHAPLARTRNLPLLGGLEQTAAVSAKRRVLVDRIAAARAAVLLNRGLLSGLLLHALLLDGRPSLLLAEPGIARARLRL